ncbi:MULTISPECIES: hypothetical protein [Sorangium]|uniref:hypothetical protein n=1 Tax=Sorangium TaxID=39643 RepID=UPI003D9C5636
MSDSTELSFPSLFTDVDRARSRVHEILRAMEDHWEDGTEIDPDLNAELRELLVDLYPRIVAALERYGHSERAGELRADWEASPEDARFVPHYHAIDSGGFVDCHAQRVLWGAIGTLKDAFEHFRANQEREQDIKIQEAQRQEARDAAQHTRTLEVRKLEAEEARSTRKWQFWLALATAVVGMAVGLGGNADKLAALVGRSPPLAQTVVLEGALAVTDRSALPNDLEIDCVPHIVGVVSAVGNGLWSLTVPPSVARPLKFYCRGVSKTMMSDSVAVSVPAGPLSRPEALPQIQLGRRPQVTSSPTGAPSATGSPLP